MYTYSHLRLYSPHVVHIPLISSQMFATIYIAIHNHNHNMSKRRRRDEEREINDRETAVNDTGDQEDMDGNADDNFNDNSNDNVNDSSPDYSSYDIDHHIRDVVRLVLGRDLRGQLIRREHIVQALPKTDVLIDIIINASVSVLRDVYGVTLIETPVKPDAKRPKTKVKQPMVLVSCLENESRQVLGELWQKSRHFEVPNNRGSSENQYLIPKYEKTDTPMANHELIKTGIMVAVVSLLIVSENRVAESELTRYMKQFGLSDNLNIRNSNYNLNLSELLADMVKREYLAKEVTKGRSESDTLVEYTLGRRSLIEFSPQSVFDYIKAVYGDKFDTNAAERTLVTIEASYGVSLSPPSEI